VSGRSTLGPTHLFVPAELYCRTLPSPPVHTFVVMFSCSSPASHHPAPNGLFLRFTMTYCPVVVTAGCAAPGHSSSREHLVDLLWADLDVEAAKHSVRQAILVPARAPWRARDCRKRRQRDAVRGGAGVRAILRISRLH
jgi:hypothetical protein